MPRIVCIGFLKKKGMSFLVIGLMIKNGVPMCLTYHSELTVLHNNKLGDPILILFIPCSKNKSVMLITFIAHCTATIM